jgi:hypothetical protein
VIYLYGVVPADAPAPPAGLTGVEDGAVRLVPAGELAGVVGEVPEAEYAEAALGARLADLAWVGPRAAAHERVLTWFSDRCPVVPLALFSLHADEDRVRARLAERRERLAGLLERLHGRGEWVVRLWHDPDAPEDAADAASPALQALAAEVEAAAPGRRFLLEKKRAALRTEERRRLRREAAGSAYRALAEAADAAVSLPPPGEAAAAGRRGALHAAFLVPHAAFDAFRERVEAVDAGSAAAGLRLELTGPWPPYHFARFDAD